jgi:hypothetical protein
VNSGKKYLVLVFVVLAVAAGVLAWRLRLENIELRGRLLGNDERDALQKRLAELTAQNKELQDMIAALQAQIGALALQARDQKNRVGENGSLGGNSTPEADTASPPVAAVGNPGQPTSQQVEALVDARYAALFKQLNLTPGQTEQLRLLLAARIQAMSGAGAALTPQDPSQRVDMATLRQAVANAEAGVNAQIESQFGDAVYAQFQQYQQTFPQRNTVNQLSQMLSGSDAALTDDQANQLVQILVQTEVPQGRGGPGRVIDGGINMHSRISAQTINAATTLLSPPQLQALQQLQKQMSPGSN